MRYSIFTLEVLVRYLPKVTDNGNSRTVTILGLSERRRSFRTIFTIYVNKYSPLSFGNGSTHIASPATVTSTLIPTVPPSRYLEPSARNWAVVASRQTESRSVHMLPRNIGPSVEIARKRERRPGNVK